MKSACHIIARPYTFICRLREMKTSGFLLQISLYIFVRSACAFQNGGSRLSSRKSPNFVMRASSSATTDSIPVLGGIREIVDEYDAFLLDMWGVMHDGKVPYEGVLEVVQELEKAGKDLVILSNSSKRQDKSIKMLKKLGFDPSDFSQIITSGEVSYHLLSRTSVEESSLAPQPWSILDSIFENSEERNVFCFGSGDGDEEYMNSCGWNLSGMANANLIIARGPFTINDGASVTDKTHDGEDAYHKRFGEQIQLAAKRSIPMIVANPDKIRPDADRSPMPGTIGDAYERALGSDETGLVKRIGKPFADVYEIALRSKDRSRVCMIGDALETDVAGGAAAGIDSIWVVKDGIHNDDIHEIGGGSLSKGCAAVLEDFNQQKHTYAKGVAVSPAAIMPHFRW